MKCKFNHLCKGKCPYAFKRQCKNYLGWSVIELLKPLPGIINYKDKSTFKLSNKIYYSKDPNKLKTTIFKHMVRSGEILLKYLSYNRAIQLALSEELITESLVVINLAPPYKDIDKGVQTIASLAELLQSQNNLS